MIGHDLWMDAVGLADTVLMRISDLFLAFPSLVFALAVAGVLGGGIQNAVIAFGSDRMAKICQTCKRTYTDSERISPYLMAVRLSGSSAPARSYSNIFFLIYVGSDSDHLLFWILEQ